MEQIQSNTPLVSVIIPMFNSAKFIPQTLESLLYQTMTDFEVVIIDDCSTDNSIEVVESFAERFGGRLNLIKLEQNTGTPGLPRNIGIKSARGKYIAFLDSDDLYTKTALEELSTLAEKYQADIVHVNDTYQILKGKKLSADDPRMTDFAALTNPANFSFGEWHSPLGNRPKPIPEPTLQPDTLEERANFWMMWKYRYATCANFCRREFLIDNQIFFPDMTVYEDQVFGFACLCLAKNYLRAPNVYYIIRPRTGSLTRYDNNVQYDEKFFRKWFGAIKSGFVELKKFMDTLPFFVEHTNLRFFVLKFFFLTNVSRNIAGRREKDYTPLFYRMVKEYFPDADVELVASMFSMINWDWLKIKELRKANAKLQAANVKLKAANIKLKSANAALQAKK